MASGWVLRCNCIMVCHVSMWPQLCRRLLHMMELFCIVIFALRHFGRKKGRGGQKNCCIQELTQSVYCLQALVNCKICYHIFDKPRRSHTRYNLFERTQLKLLICSHGVLWLYDHKKQICMATFHHVNHACGCFLNSCNLH